MHTASQLNNHPVTPPDGFDVIAAQGRGEGTIILQEQGAAGASHQDLKHPPHQQHLLAL